MTTKQSELLVNSPNTKKALAVLQKFAALETQYKEMEKAKKEAENEILQAMIAGDVTKIEFDNDEIKGYITLATRTSYKATDLSEVPDTMKKLSLDTTKVKAQHTLTGELPAGVVESTTQYLTKKIKEA